MSEKTEWNQEKCPTMKQVGYLMELEKQQEQRQAKRGKIAQIAESCGVNAASVSRYLKACCERGLLNADYELTEAGKLWLHQYERIIEELRDYFRCIGIREDLIEENVRKMIEHVNCHILSAMLSDHQKMSTTCIWEKRKSSAKIFLREILPDKLECEVYFMLFQNNPESLRVSMANDGFQKPAILKHNRRGSWLIFSICEMKARSRISGESMTGHLDTLKYEQDGILMEAKARDGRFRIPLLACRYHRRPGGEIKGVISVTMTCSVGRTHMPESTAVLVFWL